jgi:DNA-binding FadR family transcriptional regulator
MALTGTARSERMRRATTADQIRELILAQGLRPGDPLPTEAELCDELDVSRSSVREAVRTLSTLDIVEVRHGHGTFVGRMSLDPMVQALVFRGVLSPGDNLRALREVVEVRMALDLAMADKVVGAVAGTEQPELAALVSEMEAAAGRGEAFLEADRAFHTTLLATIDNQLAGQLVAAFWDIHTAVLPRLGIALPDDLRQTCQAHGDMLTAALTGDVAGYRCAVIEHYEPLQRTLGRAR